jgi:predicted transglutaminase-like cysteine proteinase
MKLLSTTFFLFLAIFSCFNSEASPLLFGKNEVRNTDIDEFPKWIKVLDKNSDEMSSYELKCNKDSQLFSCNIKNWLKFIDGLNGKSKPEQLKAVNSFVNKHKYILDINNWGVTDYWESPGEFLLKNGDCEDFAIIKYFSLRKLGFTTDDLKVVILMDKNLGIYHSILAVYSDDDIFILDNQLTNVTKSENILHYDPVYSINEDYWWRYF